MSKYRYNTLRTADRGFQCFIKQLSQQIYKWKWTIEKKWPIVNLTTAKQVLLQNLYKQVLECPWNKGMQRFYVSVLKTSDRGKCLMQLTVILSKARMRQTKQFVQRISSFLFAASNEGEVWDMRKTVFHFSCFFCGWFSLDVDHFLICF